MRVVVAVFLKFYLILSSFYLVSIYSLDIQNPLFYALFSMLERKNRTQFEAIF